jgi:hypothetical protein
MQKVPLKIRWEIGIGRGSGFIVRDLQHSAGRCCLQCTLSRKRVARVSASVVTLPADRRAKFKMTVTHAPGRIGTTENRRQYACLTAEIPGEAPQDMPSLTMLIWGSSMQARYGVSVNIGQANELSGRPHCVLHVPSTLLFLCWWWLWSCQSTRFCLRKKKLSLRLILMC